MLAHRGQHFIRHTPGHSCHPRQVARAGKWGAGHMHSLGNLAFGLRCQRREHLAQGGQLCDDLGNDSFKPLYCCPLRSITAALGPDYQITGAVLEMQSIPGQKARGWHYSGLSFQR